MKILRELNIDRSQLADGARFWWVILLAGLVSIAVGVVLVFRPGDSLKALVVIIGIFLAFSGIVGFLAAFVLDQDRVLAAIAAVLRLAVGLVLIRHPTDAVSVIGLVIGIFLIIDASIAVFGAVIGGVHRLRRALVAAIELCAGVVVIAQPHIGYTTLAVVVGIWLIVSGFGTIALGAAVHTTASDEGSSDAAGSRALPADRRGAAVATPPARR
jgi:uncharacterized membrane protein HdeD (DUF308 family)